MTEAVPPISDELLDQIEREYATYPDLLAFNLPRGIVRSLIARLRASEAVKAEVVETPAVTKDMGRRLVAQYRKFYPQSGWPALREAVVMLEAALHPQRTP